MADVDQYLRQWSAIASNNKPTGGTTIGAGLDDNLRQIQATIKLNFGDVVNVKDYGALGDNTTDDTSAIQAAITAALTSSGGVIFFPGGTYKITDELLIPFSTGWKMLGASRASVTLKQYTDNKRIFRFTASLTHSWTISGFTFDYNTPQIVGNTSAIPIHFVGAGATDSFFNFEISDCVFNNCYYGISGNSANSVTVWGGRFKRLSFSSGITGGAIRLTQTGSSGQPNNKLDQIYIDATGMTLNVLDMNACDNTEFDNIEYNTVTNGPQLLNFTGGGSLTVGQLKVEGGTYTTNNRVIFNSTDSTVIISCLKFTNSTINPGVGNQVYLVGSSGGGANYIKIDLLQVSATDVTVSSGKLYVSQALSTRKIEIDHIIGALPTNCFLTNIAATASADGTKVNAWNEPRLSSDRGDNAVTLVAGTDASIQWFNTPLSTARAVTLPTAAAENNLFNGLGYHFVRTASATGASGLDVGGLKTLAVGQWCDIVYHRSAWVLTRFGSL